MSWLKVVPVWLVVAVCLLIGLVAGWTVNGWRLDATLNAERQVHSDTLGEITRASEAQLRSQQEQRLLLEQRLADLDTTEHKELTDAQKENDRLRSLYTAADSELKRLRIDVKVARADVIVSATTGSSSMGDGASVELTDRAGRSVWHIRAGIIRDQAKLAYLQQYVKEIRREGQPP
jgi:prophage endopeptidase